MKQKYKILIVEDVMSDAELMEHELRNANIDFMSKRVDTLDHFLSQLLYFLPDIIICDQSLPQFDAFSAMRALKEKNMKIPFLLITGALSDEEAIDYLKEGAYDYILKKNLKRLPFAVKNALSKYELTLEMQDMQLAHAQLGRHHRESAERSKNVTDSILYAKGIQTALLPKENYMQKYFPESFLINMPKDILSGDFYWFSEYNEKFIVAVGDCTGHGVPAALISMMGYNKLNYIVNKMGETDPAKILDDLNFEIQEVFKNETCEMSIQDGMDIAICVIDRKSGHLEFAGANRPLYFVSHEGLNIIKGDKKCIGGSHGPEKFTRHCLPISSVNGVYLFTDGFLDQFGGESGKKFLNKRFKALLSSSQGCSMSDQMNILVNALNDWRGEAEQTDDICVLGIRL